MNIWDFLQTNRGRRHIGLSDVRGQGTGMRQRRDRGASPRAWREKKKRNLLWQLTGITFPPFK